MVWYGWVGNGVTRYSFTGHVTVQPVDHPVPLGYLLVDRMVETVAVLVCFLISFYLLCVVIKFILFTRLLHCITYLLLSRLHFILLVV